MLSLSVILLLIVAVGGSGIMVAVLGWLYHRLNRLETLGPERLGRLEADFEALQDQLGSVQETLDTVIERVDFTERLLERPETSESHQLPPA